MTIVQELEQVRKRLKDLLAFIRTDVFTELEMLDRNLLLEQRDTMIDYANILDQRIKRM